MKLKSDIMISERLGSPPFLSSGVGVGVGVNLTTFSTSFGFSFMKSYILSLWQNVHI